MGKMRILVFISLIIIMIFTNSVDVIALERNKINFNHITIEDGLSQTTVEYIFQDSEGYMWFGTDDGLNRYDGINFKIYRYEGDGEGGLASNWIPAINEDKYGNIWVGTSRGLNKINKKSGDIITYVADGKDGSLSSSNICEIFIDSKGRILISTENGINVYNDKTDGFDRIFYSEHEDVLTSQTVFSIVEDSNNTLWIATDSGLNSYNQDTGEVKKYTTDNGENSISSNFIYDLHIDKKDNLWISTNGGGLNKLDIKTGNMEIFLHDEQDSTSIPGNDVTNVLVDSKDRVWIATNKGLARLVGNKFIRYNSKIYDKRSLINSRILNIYQDKSGLIWVGTSDGISMFNPDSIFETYRNDPFDKNTINENNIFGIYEDNEGLIWVGTSNNGVNIIDRKSKKIYRLSDVMETNDIFTSERIVDINGFGEKIWIITNGELILLNRYTKEARSFFMNSETKAKEIYIDNDGITWIGTNNGLYSIDNEDNIKDYFEEFDRNQISQNNISTIYKDSKGILWIGLAVDGGLLRYNLNTGEIKQYKNIVGDKSSISYNSIKAINEDLNGDIWIGTNYGLNKYNRDADSFIRYTEINGLANDFVYGILVDEDNNLWISTNYGISRYDVEKNNFINFGIEDGLQGSEFNMNSAFKTKSGEMIFGGINGLNIFCPRDFKEDLYKFDVAINKVAVDGENFNFNDKIQLNYNEKNLEIEFFLPDYRNSKKIVYAYKMEGMDSEWIISQNRNYVNYNNIHSGKYKLLLTAKNSYGVWSDPKEIEIYKRKHPLKTVPACIMYLISIIVVGYIVWNRVKLLDSLVKQRTLELDLKLKENVVLYEKLIDNEVIKNNYFINLSHELRTPLNVILSTQQLIKNLNSCDKHIDKVKLDYYMNILTSNSKRLLKLINDIIDTSKIEAGSYKLEILEHDIVYNVEEIVLSMKDYIESKGLEIIIDPFIEEKIIECDMAEIEKCIINLLGNAIKFTPSGGKIEVIISELEDKVKIDVTDTGIGIDEKDIEAIFKRFEQAYNKKNEEFGGSGIGLFLTKQLISLHNGELLVKSKIGEGSTFTIILPIKHNSN